MRAFKTALGSGAAAIAVLGCCGIALAQAPQSHVLTVSLPGGGLEQIEYTGSVAPQVYVSDAPAPAAFPALFGVGSPFAEMARISAAMDRQADQLFREAAAIDSGAATPNLTAVGALPASAREYAFMETAGGSGVCRKSMVITSQGNGAPPHVVTHSSGNCAAGAAPGFRVPTQLPTAPQPYGAPRTIMTKAAHPATAPRVVMAKAAGSHRPAGTIHEASLN